MTIEQMLEILENYKLRIPPTVYYELLADVQELEEEQEPTTKNDLALIHTEGLDEEIRCTMCTNYMKSDRGCDGSCVVNKDMYKAVVDVIEKRIQPTTKNNLGVDCISRADVLKLMQDNWHTHNGDWAMQESMDDIRALPSVTPQEPRWIPLTTRPMTEEETEHYFKYTDVRIDDTYTILGCPLSDDGQEVLVSCGGYVGNDVFIQDNEGCYFEGRDIDDVDAWMPLPKPYEPQESEVEDG